MTEDEKLAKAKLRDEQAEALADYVREAFKDDPAAATAALCCILAEVMKTSNNPSGIRAKAQRAIDEFMKLPNMYLEVEPKDG